MNKKPKKIENLSLIKNITDVPEFIYFNYKSYQNNKLAIIKKISKKFKKKIIIRSAAFDEDAELSNAGKYLSITDINIHDHVKIMDSINKVFKSYDKKNLYNSILIQEYISNSSYVGVVFTSDPKNGYPFRTINFIKSNKTDLITSGTFNGSTITYFKNTKKLKLKSYLNKLNKIIIILEKKFSGQDLDIEFLISKNKIWILQVRKLYVNRITSINFSKSLNDLEKKLIKMMSEKSHLVGNKRFFSTMTDWNPAEIIGLKPKPLAFSLYQSLITDEIWSRSRSSLGYMDVTGYPLMYSFYGTPYIDIKTDINSFLINNLTENIKSKLVNFYFKEFKKKPDYYFDKIESDLVINCISLNKKKYKNILLNSSLTKFEIDTVINKYHSLTNKIILELNNNVNKYKLGEKKFLKLKKSQNSSINKIHLLYNLCKSYGTLPFANLARMAFIAVEFMNSLVELKIITEKEKELLIESNKSISFEMNSILKKNKTKFLRKYGHLRPNIYEISNPNYKNAFTNYFTRTKKKITKEKKFHLNKMQLNKINLLIKKNKFHNLNATDLIKFIQNAIYERESSKLFFSKVINEIFEELKILSNRIGLAERDIQYLNFKSILELYKKFDHNKILYNIKKEVNENKKDYSFNLNFNLPNIITNPKEIYFFKELNASPTFITNKITTGKIAFIKKINKKFNLDNKIICIENADPGYDFIFNHNIKGLITAFGGPNSHMCIRCYEFSIPAAIGVGEKKFKILNKNTNIYLNCEKKMLTNL